MTAEGKGTRLWRNVGLWGGPLLAVLLLGPLGDAAGLGERPSRAAAVAALMAIWWFTEALPIAWTACLPLVLYPALGVFEGGLTRNVQESVEPFTDAYIFLFMGGMALGAAMEQWNLHRRIALHILLAVGTQPKRLLLGMLLATATVSMWISNTATAVMMLPIAMALLGQLEQAQGGGRLVHFGGALTLSVAYAANIGGIGTKIGTATNSAFVGFISEKLGVELSFPLYMAIGTPFVLLFLPLGWAVLWREGRRDALGPAQGRQLLLAQLQALGPVSAGERTVAIVFATAAVLWIFGDPLRAALAPWVSQALGGFRLLGKHYEAAVAMAAALTLMALRRLSLAALRRVPWGTLLLLGGSFALAAGIEGSGLSSYLATRIEPLARLPLPGQLLLAAAATILLSAVASNTATINLMLNVMPQSLPVLTAANLAASCDFALPAGTPPNAIVFGSGYVRLPTMMRVGLVLDLCAALAIAAYVWLYARHLLPG